MQFVNLTDKDVVLNRQNIPPSGKIARMVSSSNHSFVCDVLYRHTTNEIEGMEKNEEAIYIVSPHVLWVAKLNQGWANDLWLTWRLYSLDDNGDLVR